MHFQAVHVRKHQWNLFIRQRSRISIASQLFHGRAHFNLKKPYERNHPRRSAIRFLPEHLKQTAEISDDELRKFIIDHTYKYGVVDANVAIARTNLAGDGKRENQILTEMVSDEIHALHEAKYTSSDGLICNIAAYTIAPQFSAELISFGLGTHYPKAKLHSKTLRQDLELATYSAQWHCLPDTHVVLTELMQEARVFNRQDHTYGQLGHVGKLVNCAILKIGTDVALEAFGPLKSHAIICTSTMSLSEHDVRGTLQVLVDCITSLRTNGHTPVSIIYCRHLDKATSFGTRFKNGLRNLFCPLPPQFDVADMKVLPPNSNVLFDSRSPSFPLLSEHPFDDTLNSLDYY